MPVSQSSKIKVTLVDVYWDRIFYENLGLNRIAAFLEQQGIPVEIRYIKDGTPIDENLLSLFSGQQLIGFAAYDINLDYIGELTWKIKQSNKGAVVCYGSQFVTLTYREMLIHDKNVDFLVLGDGEYPVFEFAKKYAGPNKEQLVRDSQNLASHLNQLGKNPSFVDISKLPWPRHDDRIVKENLYTYIQSSYGCLGDCTFCALVRRKWSWRSPEDVMAEIVSIRKLHNIRAFVFTDSHFGDVGREGRRRISKFVDLVEKDDSKYAFCAYFRAEAFKNTLADREYLSRLRQAGCILAYVGIEAGSSEDLRLYNKRANLQDNREILEVLRLCDIEPLLGFMMFNPYSTEETLYDNYEFLVEYENFDPVHFINPVTIYKNTQLYNKTKADDLIVEHQLNKVQYKFRNEFASKVSDFFKKRYFSSSLFASARNISDSTRLYSYLSVLVDDTQREAEIVRSVKRQLALLNQNYFGIVYMQRDLQKADDELETYVTEVKACSDRLTRIKLSMIRKYFYKYGS